MVLLFAGDDVFYGVCGRECDGGGRDCNINDGFILTMMVVLL